MIVASSNSTPNFGISYLLEWVALVLVAIFVWRYVINGGLNLRRRMNSQTEAIKEQLTTGERLREEAEQLIEQRRSSLERARTEGETIISQAERNSEALLQQGRERADDEYAYALSRAASAIEQARIQLRDEVLSEIGSAVVTAAARVVSAELNEPIHHRLIAEAIAAAETEAVV